MRTISTSKKPVSAGLRLSQRGVKVFAFILDGMNTMQIAKRLGISYSGVRRHREKMLRDNHCVTMSELIALHHGRPLD